MKLRFITTLLRRYQAFQYQRARGNVIPDILMKIKGCSIKDDVRKLLGKPTRSKACMPQLYLMDSNKIYNTDRWYDNYDIYKYKYYTIRVAYNGDMLEDYSGSINDAIFKSDIWDDNIVGPRHYLYKIEERKCAKRLRKISRQDQEEFLTQIITIEGLKKFIHQFIPEVPKMKYEVSSDARLVKFVELIYDHEKIKYLGELKDILSYYVKNGTVKKSSFELSDPIDQLVISYLNLYPEMSEKMKCMCPLIPEKLNDRGE